MNCGIRWNFDYSLLAGLVSDNVRKLRCPRIDAAVTILTLVTLHAVVAFDVGLSRI